MRITRLLEDDWAEVEIGGVVSQVSVALLEGPRVGDHVIVHAGFAITRLSIEEAEKTLLLFAEITDHLARGADAIRQRVS
jgi:hydrogenase expression/formation protein HypC